MLARVELRGIAKVFEPRGIKAVGPLDLDVEEGALQVIVGPSGSGKSTLLRLIAGLESPTSGSLWMDGRRADGLAPRDRDVALVFQGPVLYPYLSVFENLAFGLRARGVGRSEVARGVAEASEMLGLGGLLDRRPSTLSGGERQRVALGRALARRPRVLLLDEPFSSLDGPLRVALRDELVDLQRRLGTTTIHVTHDQGEALAIGTRLAVLDGGRIVQAGAPMDVYDHPASRFVGAFLGSPPMSVLPCLVEPTGTERLLRVVDGPEEAAWTIDDGSAWAAPLRKRAAGRVDLGVRAEHVRACSGATTRSVGTVVRRIEALGHESVATLAMGPHTLKLRLPAQGGERVAVGSSIRVAIDFEDVAWFDPETGLALPAS